MISKDNLTSALKEALMAGDSFKAGVLRLLLSSCGNKEIEKRGKGGESFLTEEELIEVLAKEAKKRREAAEIYLKGGRRDLADKETAELKIIEEYLPARLSAEEIEKIVGKAIEKIGAKEAKDFGKAMAEAMKELKGRADARDVSEIIKKKLR